MKTFLTLLTFFFLITPAITLAQYQPLVGIPGVGTDSSNFDQYLQAVYATSISLAALLAVIKIVIAGVKWMTTDIVSSKSAAKSDIQGAILGLIVILGAVLILYIINPNIGAVSLDLAPAPRPEPLSTDGTELAEMICSSSSYSCTVTTCNTENRPTCDEAMANCAGSGRVTGENTIVCEVNEYSGGVFDNEVEVAGVDGINAFIEAVIPNESPTETRARISAIYSEEAGYTQLYDVAMTRDELRVETRCAERDGDTVVYYSYGPSTRVRCLASS